LILALETATPICSVALFNPKTNEIQEKRADGRGAHSTKLLVFIHELLAEMGANITDLAAIIVSIGPGSFTGLRIASSAIKGLAFGRNIPILTYNTTYAIASAAVSLGLSGNIHGVIDARRTHLYHQKLHVEDGIITQCTQPKIYAIEELVKQHVNLGDHLFGTGLARLNLTTNHSGFIANDDMREISAKQLLTLVKADSKEMGLIAYIAELGINANELKILYSLD